MVNIDQIKMLTIRALLADDVLMGILVLKGGNALNLAYEITNRGSIDIDFSIEGEFSSDELNRLKNQMESLLDQEFKPKGVKVFDVKLYEKPEILSDAVKDFWGGYFLEFKTIELEQFNKINTDLDKLRRNAIPLHLNNSTKFTVDISKYEYVGKSRAIDIDGTVLKVYSPAMLALEKLRALCQQNPKYKSIVKEMTPKSRARDFYDIHSIVNSFNIDFLSDENMQIRNEIFEAKRVPISYIDEIIDQKELHSSGWDSVLDTVGSLEMEGNFDYYFDFVINVFNASQ